MKNRRHTPEQIVRKLREADRRRKRQRLGESVVPAHRLRARALDHVWAIDFQFDQTADGHKLKLLHVVDEFTREALAIECRRRIDTDHTVQVLDRLVARARDRTRVHPLRQRAGDDRQRAQRRCRFSRAGSAYIEPGSPWQNTYVESFGGRVRDELLAVVLFSCLAEAKVLIERGLAHRLQPTPTALSAQDDDPRRVRPRLKRGRPGGRARQRRTALDLRLAPFDAGGTLTLQSPTNHQLSQQVDR